LFLPTEYRDGWVKLPLGGLSSDSAKVHLNEAFKEGTKRRLYFLSLHLRPRAVDATVWRIDRDDVVFRFTGPSIAPPLLDRIPSARQVPLSGALALDLEEPAAMRVLASILGCLIALVALVRSPYL
jgi:hypothetical protein